MIQSINIYLHFNTFHNMSNFIRFRGLFWIARLFINSGFLF